MNKEDRVLRKIRHVEYKTKKLVNALVLGNYRAVMKGQGMTFSDFREYVPGDDVRNISWSLIAKTNKPYVKQYEEERELNAYFLVDTNITMFQGSKEYLKMEQALYSVAALAMAAQKSNDLSGLILYSNVMKDFIPAKKGKVHIRRLISEIINAEPESGTAQGLVESCEMLLKYQKKRSIIFIFSDFLNIAQAKIALQSLTKKHQVIACVLTEETESSLQDFGTMRFVNFDQTESEIMNGGFAPAKSLFTKFYKEKRQTRDKILGASGLDVIHLSSQSDIYKPILKYFKTRAKRV
ncbi:MAG: DUF58 domain-containing protein [Bdellovibrionaceae bacterium]|nr:DUF58 domain-containing protein [Pseudobdellovibrionaceae bacterium]